LIPADTIFAFSALLDRPDADVLPYVDFWLEALENEEITVGGMNSRGLGVVALENLCVKYQGGWGKTSKWQAESGDLLDFLKKCLVEGEES
jgi:CRISPR/Cas system CSM-associated protein Csm3 (group 7 of RAMP superfamily)